MSRAEPVPAEPEPKIRIETTRNGTHTHTFQFRTLFAQNMDFIHITLVDVIDILVVAVIFYQIYRLIRGTAAMTIFVGIFIFYLLWIVVKALSMTLLSSIMGQIIGVGELALVIVFQQEIRRYLLLFGSRSAQVKNRFVRRMFRSAERRTQLQWIEKVAKACQHMAANATGALICIERQGDLGAYAATGDLVDARIDARLLETIFFKNSPLHDGAVIIKQGRIHAARCMLPVSDNPNIPPRYGMRHRAAVGLSEHSDVVIVVVSEERGEISIVEAGEIVPIDRPETTGERLGAILSA